MKFIRGDNSPVTLSANNQILSESYLKSLEDTHIAESDPVNSMKLKPKSKKNLAKTDLN